MKFCVTLLLLLGSVLSASSQPSKKPEKKYPSLLWEITGNGLSKPSYLFGTMHVSNKQVFHLSDSFFYAIRKTDVVALELNSETWQRDMVQMDNDGDTYQKFYSDKSLSDGYIKSGTFRMDKDFVSDIKYALLRQPYIINSLLYRNNEGSDDYEEDTFLDMYIYQTAKKLGKRSSGVESYYEMQMLSMEAEIDRSNEKNKKKKTYDYDYNDNPRVKSDDAYRKGDLDMLDSLEKMMLESEAFTEKFLYKRNEKQANSMDTIMKKGNSLFVGVGAAHLPGDRGVIELLRKKGYTLRPIKMIDRDAVQREKIDHLHVPVTFVDNVADDGFYKVKLPGVLYKRSDLENGTGWQYADMANGAYYTVTRIENPGGFTGVSESEAFRKVDSLLYDNIPGKILKKTVVIKNGYKCIDISNKTRRGDVQRYNIVFTPFEVLIFKMSGTENYVLGKEAEDFFKSITLTPYQNAHWVNYQPPAGGFNVQLPHKPFIKNELGGDWMWAANDNNVNYLVLKRTVFNDEKLLRDTLNLGLMEESFTGKEKGLQLLERKFGEKNKASTLDALYQTADTSFLKVHYVINGPQHYLTAAKSKNKADVINNKVTSSFTLSPFVYGAPKIFGDTLLNFVTQTPIVPVMNDSLKALMHQYGKRRSYNYYGGGNNDEEYEKYGKTLNMSFTNDTTGEIITVNTGTYGKYYFENDSLKRYRGIADSLAKAIPDDALLTKQLDSLYRIARGDDNFYSEIDSMYIVKDKKFIYRNGISTYYVQYTDTGCSRIVTRCVLSKNNRHYTINTITGAGEEQSSFIKNFFANFKPFKEIKADDIYLNKVDTFLADYYSKDTTVRKLARSAIDDVDFGKKDIKKMTSAMNSLSLKDKDYFETKTKWIEAIGDIKDTSARPQIMQELKNIYEKTADTSLFQSQVLKGLAGMHTKESYALLKQYILQDPPLSDNEYSYDNDFWSSEDSLELVKTLFPEILQLTNLDDYKLKVTNLLVKLVDSGRLEAKDYESYFSKILFDAKIALKKQLLKDEKKVQEELSKEEDETNTYNKYGNSGGNDELVDYAVLLLPFSDKNPAVQKYIDKLWQVKDDKLKFDLMLKMLSKNKAIPDTLVNYFAAVEEKRGALYYRLSKLKKENLFPSKYKVQDDMARAFLYTTIAEEDKDTAKMLSLYGYKKYMGKYLTNFYNSYKYNGRSDGEKGKMDSISFIKKEILEVGKEKGFVYFYKYREKKDDKWRIAISGLQPTDGTGISYRNVFTSFTDEKIKEEESLDEQLSFQLKKIIFANREGSENFFSESNYYNRNSRTVID